MGETEHALLRRVYSEWGTGDYSSGDFVHPQFELVFAPGFLEEGTYVGPREAFRGWQAWLAQWASWEYTPVEWFDLPDGRIGVYIDIDGVSRSTGMQLSVKSANLWEIEDGLVKRLRIYAHRDDMLRELGLESP
jgi:ketosteroid isomerase-like protein